MFFVFEFGKTLAPSLKMGCARMGHQPGQKQNNPIGDTLHGAGLFTYIPRKLQHTPGAHPRQSPYPTMTGFPLQPVGKGLGVCSKGVLKQP